MQKKLSKILTTIFLLIFIFQLVGLIFLLAVPEASQAADQATFKPQVGIGDDFKKGETTTIGDSTEMIGKYINAIYKYAIGIVGILAAVVLMFGGVMWLTAGGNAERIGNAKSWIGAALTGLVLALASYTILYTVNPDLVNFKITEIQNVKDKSTEIHEYGGCCIYDSCDNNFCTITTEVCLDLAISEKVCKGYKNGEYIANAECKSISSNTATYWSCSPVAETTSTTDPTGCCSFEFSGEIRCRENYTKKKCDTRNNSTWDEGIECWENSFCEYIYPVEP